MLHHPDRGGDPIRFMKITKAHQALTDEEARKNWEEYGNPDGPGGMPGKIVCSHCWCDHGHIKTNFLYLWWD